MGAAFRYGAPPADPGLRLVARGLDLGVAFGLIVSVNVPTLLFTDSRAAVSPVAEVVMGCWITAVVLGYLAVPVCSGGSTVGKRLVGLRVVRLDGGPVRPGRVLGRELFLLAGVAFPFFGLGNALAIFNDPYRAQCGHDRTARTYVVRRPPLLRFGSRAAGPASGAPQGLR